MLKELVAAFQTWAQKHRVVNLFRGMKEPAVSIIFLIIISIVMSPPQANAKPTFSLSLPTGFSFPRFSGADGGGFLGNVQKRSHPGMKLYTGLRMSNDSLLMIYWHDQTVAVAELGPNKLLLNCELIEVYDDEDRELLLEEMSSINRPLRISFPKMMKLMSQCQQVDGVAKKTKRGRSIRGRAVSQSVTRDNARGLLDNSPFSLLSGIIPGTKWCGTGDIAVSYHDLGSEKSMDKCCRNHDLCPVKVRAFQQRYNLTNTSIYSKSHCSCDEAFMSCLKETNTSASQVLGNIYFNLVRVPCVEDSREGRRFRDSKEGF